MQAVRILLLVCTLMASMHAHAIDAEAVRKLAFGESDEQVAAVAALVAEGDAQSAALLQSLADGEVQTAGKLVLIVKNDSAIDATTGQNGLVQAKAFAEVANVTGIVLTKLDGTAKGGIVYSIQQQLGIPVKLIAFGEGINDFAFFEAYEFARGLVGL